MKLDQLLDKQLLSKRVLDGSVSERKHPTLPLTIYNYTAHCQYSNAWDDITRKTRGLIVANDDDTVLARPWEKFFNINTESIPETLVQNLPSYAPEITTKMDGSLGILWHYKHHVGIATRGSFESEQSRWASEFYYKKHFDAKWPQELTILFEIIYKANRIVVDYGDFQGLVLLGAVETETGRSIPHHELFKLGQANHIPTVKLVDKPIADCLAENTKNAEGYVLTWNPGWDGKTFKVKIKFEDYVRLHRVLTGINERDVWEVVASGRELSVLIPPGVNPSYASWVYATATNLRDKKTYLSSIARGVMMLALAETRHTINLDAKQRRKALAQVIIQYPVVAAAVFAILDGKDHDKILWKLLYPTISKQFRQDGV